MRANKLTATLAALIIAMLVCSVAVSGVMPERTTDSIYMIQPCGWAWCAQHDAHYAGSVNLPNSLANENNRKADWYSAEAKRIKSEIGVERATLGMLTFGISSAFWLSIIGLIGVTIWSMKSRG